MKRFFAIILFLWPALIQAQAISNIMVQPAEWEGMPVYPAGTRTNATVTFGIGIADSLAIDCPGTQDLPQNEGSPTKLELKNGGAQLNSQFRCMARWPSGNAKWVLVDAQLPSFAECQATGLPGGCTGTNGYDTTITLTQVASGGGNFPSTSMAVQCTGSATPVSGCPDSNHILINTTAATFLIKEANFNLFDDVNVGGTHLVSASTHGPNDGLYLSGPSHTQFALGTIDSVSCWPNVANSSGPMPTNYAGATVCNTAYLSNADPNSNCVIEENGPLRSVLMCQGALINSNGDSYLWWRTRMHFYANHKSAKVTVALRNANVPTSCCTTATVANASREFGEFDAVLTDNLGNTTRNFGFGNDSGWTPGTISSAQSAYIYQAHSNFDWQHWNAGGNPAVSGTGREGDVSVVSYEPRSCNGTGTGSCNNPQFAKEGYEIVGTGGTVIKSGTSSVLPLGAVDYDDGMNGIEAGVYQLGMYYSKSLEIQPGGTGVTTQNELRIGIWPNQQEYLGSINEQYCITGFNCPPGPGVTISAGAGTNTITVSSTAGLTNGATVALISNSTTSTTLTVSSFTTSTITFGSATPSGAVQAAWAASSGAYSQPITSYVMQYPQYSIHDLYFNFHTGLLSGSSYAAAQQDFLDFQHPMLARPALPTYYNTVTDGPSGVMALKEPMVDPIAEDVFYQGLTGGPYAPLCSGIPIGQCVGDVNQPGFAYTGTGYAGMHIFRFFNWPTAGGVNGTQYEQKLSFMRNWLERGCTPNGGTSLTSGTFPACASPSLVGSTPGRKILADHFYRMITEKSVPHSDTSATPGTGCGGAGNGCITSGAGAGFRHLCTTLTVCKALTFSPWGDPKNNTTVSSFNGGMRNWTDTPDSQGHAVYTGYPDYYFLTGDEWAKEQLLQGFKDRFQNPFVPYNSIAAAFDPFHGGLTSTRITGWWINMGARMMEFLHSIRDPDMDTATTLLTSPGTSSTGATAGQNLLQDLAIYTAQPFIGNTGFPVGWTEYTTQNCTTGLGGQNCSSGVSPVKLFSFDNGDDGGVTCGGGTPPCNSGKYRAQDLFQHGVQAEGVFTAWSIFRELLGTNNWFYNVGSCASSIGGTMPSPPIDGATTVPGNCDLVSGKRLLDTLYGIGQMNHEEIEYNTGSEATSGYPYTTAVDYINASPGCTSSGNCLPGASGSLSGWFGIFAQAFTTNSIFGYGGATPGNNMEFMFESQLMHAQPTVMELGSNIEQAAEYFILNNYANGGNATTLGAVPFLKQVPLTVTGCTGTGCTFTSTGCIAGSATGTCTITWTPPGGLSTVNGTQYRLKYFPCHTGTLTIYGNDCPSGGKTIVPALNFSSSALGTGTNAADGSGSWTLNPATNENWAWGTTDVPDGGANTLTPTGASYTFNTAANTTYTFHLAAYSTSAAILIPTSQAFFSAAVGTSSGDSFRTFTLTAGASSLASLTFPFTGDFSRDVGTPGTCSTSLAAGTSCTVNVDFIATATSSPNGRTGTVCANYTGGSLCSNLTGTGLAAGGVCIIPPIFGAGCNALYVFNSQTVGLASSDSPAPETLSNTGPSLTGIVCSTTGTNAGDFTIGGSCATTLANDATYNIPTTFTPSATGSRTGNLSVSYGGGGGGTVHTLADCQSATLQSYLNSISTGTYTVIIPSGTCTWVNSGSTSPVVWNVPSGITGFTLQGQTTCSPSTPGSIATSCTDNTVIIDNVNYSSCSGCRLLSLTGTSSTTVPISIIGITWKENSSSKVNQNGQIAIGGSTQSLRISQNHFSSQSGIGNGVWATIYNCQYGVIDHSVFDMPNGTPYNGIRVSQGGNCYSDSSGNGNGVWDNATNFGTNKFLFFENNTFNGGISNDCNDGGTQVFRYNIYNDSSSQTHEMEGDMRGCRATEVYGNTFTGVLGDNIGSFTAVGARMGTQLIWGNSSTLMFNLIALDSDRTGPNHPFSLPPAGYGYCGEKSWNGIVNTSGTTVTWVSGNNFDDPNTSPPDIYPVVAGNTININGVDYTIASASGTPATTITLTTSAGTQTGVVFYFKSGWDGNSNVPYGYPCYDQSGRGQSDVITGTFPTKCDSTLGCPTYYGSWPNNKLEPIYEWLDKYQVGATQQNNIYDNPDTTIFALNRDYFAYTLSWNGSAFTGTAFNGTVGTGSGLHSARPSTCTAGPGGTYGASPTGSYGVAYWATDDNGGIGELYVCTATNTWTAVYEPYTYPHPLDTAGGSGSVSAPLAGTGISASVTLLCGGLSSYAFSSVAVGSNSSDSPVACVLLNNTGSSITSLTIGFTTGVNFNDIAGNACGSTLASGVNCIVSVTFNPTVIGALSDSLNATYTGGSVSAAISGTGLANPQVQLVPGTLTYSIPTGTNAAQNVTLTNTGTTALTIISLVLSDNMNYSLPVSGSPCPISPSTLGAGSSCIIAVEFAPAVGGTLNATLNVNDNAAGTPQQVTLLGTATAAPTNPTGLLGRAH